MLDAVALGCVIRGETTHYEIVSEQSARGIMDLTLQGIAIGNGILTVEDEDQAWERASAEKLDKGGGAAASGSGCQPHTPQASGFVRPQPVQKLLA